MTSPACFISDLHLLSPRSMAERWLPAIDAACRDSQLIVLGGDIFDFRWATLGSHGATLAAANQWLTNLVECHPHAQTVYIMGNHDSHPDMQNLLVDLAHRYSHFKWQPELFRLADCLFCHGDILDAGSQSQLASYRLRFQHERSPSQTAHRLYNAAVAMRLHRTVPKLLHRPRATCARLRDLLNLQSTQLPPDLAKVERVFFGHTHVPIYELPLDEIHYYNPGAAMRHMNFAPIQFDINIDKLTSTS